MNIITWGLGYFFNVQFVKFLFTGLLNTIVGYFIFSLVYYISGMETLSLVVTYGLGVVFNFVSYAKIVFSSHRRSRLFVFIMVYFSVLLVNLGIIKILIYVIGVGAYLGQFFSLLLSVPLLYFLLRQFVFRNK